jgi:hypothetical protein
MIINTLARKNQYSSLGKGMSTFQKVASFKNSIVNSFSHNRLSLDGVFGNIKFVEGGP